MQKRVGANIHNHFLGFTGDGNVLHIAARMRRLALRRAKRAEIVLAKQRLRGTVHGIDRSEEHTSELQSLMRISYAVFCLQKKTQTKLTTTRYSTQRP